MALSKKATLALEGLAKRGDSFARHAINKYITPRDTMLLKSLAKRGDLVARRHLQGLSASHAAKELVARKAKEGDYVMQGLNAGPTGPAGATADEAEQTITFALENEAFDTDSVTLAATATSGLPVTFSVLSGPGDITAGVLSFTGDGAVVVAADQAGNTSFKAAPRVTQTITITAAA